MCFLKLVHSKNIFHTVDKTHYLLVHRLHQLTADPVHHCGALVEPVLALLLALGVQQEEGQALLVVEVLLDAGHLALVLEEHAGEVGEAPVDDGGVAALAVVVLLGRELGQVQQAFTALEIGVMYGSHVRCQNVLLLNTLAHR